MLLIEVLALVFAKVREHRTVVHAVAIQNQVIGNTNVAVFLHIGNAVVAVRFIKGVLAALPVMVSIASINEYPLTLMR